MCFCLVTTTLQKLHVRKCRCWTETLAPEVATCLQVKDTEIRGTKFVVPGLKEGGLYRFRVRAVNAAGVGEPGLVSEVIEVKDRTSEFSRHRLVIH